MPWAYFRCLTCQEQGNQHIARTKDAPGPCALCGGKLWSEIDRPADARECPYCDRVYPASLGLCPFCEDR